MISTKIFADRIEAFLQATAIVTSNGREFSYVELASQADTIASEWGDDRHLVMVEASNEIEPLSAYLGALRHRHPVILVAPGASEDDRRILDKYKPDIIFERREGRWQSTRANALPASALHDDLAVLLSTSGSTGDPKLVRLSLCNIESNAQAIGQYLALNDDRAITSLPWNYSYGMSVVNSYLASGGTLLLTDRSVVDDEFWTFFRNHGGRCSSRSGSASCPRTGSNCRSQSWRAKKGRLRRWRAYPVWGLQWTPRSFCGRQPSSASSSRMSSCCR